MKEEGKAKWELLQIPTFRSQSCFKWKARMAKGWCRGAAAKGWGSL